MEMVFPPMEGEEAPVPGTQLGLGVWVMPKWVRGNLGREASRVLKSGYCRSADEVCRVSGLDIHEQTL